MNKLCLFLSMFMLAAGTPAAESEVVAKNQAVFVVQSNLINRTYVCHDGVAKGEIKDGVVHASLLRGGSRYLLIAYSEPSRPSHPNGRCGGGVESYLVWLQVRGSTLVAAQSVQFESCWKDIEPSISEEETGWHGPLFIVQFEQFHYNKETKTGFLTNHQASFDHRVPQKGIQVSEIKTDP